MSHARRTMFTCVIVMLTCFSPAVRARAVSESKQGDVILGLNSLAAYGRTLAPFIEAIWAWENRLMVNDSSPGAVPPTSPPTFTVGYELRDDQGNAGRATANSVENWVTRGTPVHAQVGMSSTATTIPSAAMAHHTEQVMIGYAVPSVELSDKNLFAYYFRTAPSGLADIQALGALLLKLRAAHAIVLYEGEPFQGGLFAAFREIAPAGLTLVAEPLVPQQVGQEDPERWRPSIRRVRDMRERYLIGPFSSNLDVLWELIKEEGLFSIDRQWLGTTTTLQSPVVKPYFAGMLGLRLQSRSKLWLLWAQWTATLDIDRFPQWFKSERPYPLTADALRGGDKAPYEGFLADATFALLFAIERLHAAGTPLANCRGPALRQELLKTQFQGTSGLVRFDAAGDRVASFVLWNVNAQGVPVTKGQFIPGVGLVTGGWEGSPDSPNFPPLIFTNGSTTPLQLFAAGCPKGLRYIAATGGCRPCTLGTYNPTDGSLAEECIACETGFFASETGLAVCHPCSTGTFQNETGASSCVACEAGWSSDAVGLSSCERCGVGTFSLPGATTCASCALGSYASDIGSTGCMKCGAGFSTEFVGSSSPSACACPPKALFIGRAYVSSVSHPVGSCLDCAADRGLTNGLTCMGGRMCDSLPERTVLESFACPAVGDDCLDPTGGCGQRCIVPVGKARELCESFQLRTLCEGWAVQTSALLHGDLLEPEGRLGWQNVAVLGRLAADLSTATFYGKVAKGWSLVPKRSMCSPVASGDPEANNLAHPKHNVTSFPQPPIVKAGYYMPDLAAVRHARLPNTIDGREPDANKMQDLLDADLIAESDRTLGAPAPWTSAWRLLAISADATADQTPGPVPLFKCKSPTICSGGGIGQCPPGQVGLSCARCAPGFYTSAATACAKCTGGGDLATIVLTLTAVALVVILALLYTLTLHPLASKLTAKMTTGLALGLTFNGVQSFGVISLINVQFGEPLLSILATLRLFLFDMDQLQWECIVPVSSVGKLSARLLLPPGVCLVYFCLFLTSRIVARAFPSRVRPWTVAHTCNCTGMVLQVLFISICMAVILPFKCSQHPVQGISTLVDIPAQVCGVGDQVAMSILGAIFIMLYPVLGLALSSYIIYILPDRTAQDPTFVNSFKFLVMRFRFDRYYYGIVFMVRNLGIALVPVVNPSNPMLQQVVMAAWLLLALVTQALLWPWAASEINYLDLASLLCMMMTVMLSTSMVDTTTLDSGAMATAAAAVVAGGLGMTVLVVLKGAMQVIGDSCDKRGICRPVASLVKSRTSKVRETEEMTEAVKHVAGVLNSWTKRNVSAFIDALPAYDKNTLLGAVAMLLGAIDVDPSLFGSSTQISARQRITVTRFKRRSSLQIDDHVHLSGELIPVEGQLCASKADESEDWNV